MRVTHRVCNVARFIFLKNIQQKKKYYLFSINNIHVGVLQYYLFV